MAENKEEIISLQLAEMSRGLSSMQQNMAAMQLDMAAMRQDMTTMQQDVAKKLDMVKFDLAKLNKKIDMVEFDLSRTKVELSAISKARDIGITSQWPASPFAEPRILLNSVSHPAWANRTQSRYFPDE